MMKKGLALVAMVLLVGWGVVGSIGSANANDPLERRIARLEKQVRSLRDTRDCLDTREITQYQFTSPGGTTATGLDFTRTDLDYVGGIAVLWVCKGSP